MTRKVTITYTDDNSLTDAEIVKSCKQMYGDSTEITINPADNDYIYFGIQKRITEELVKLFFDEGKYMYSDSMPVLRQEILSELESTLNQVIMDIEEKIV